MALKLDYITDLLIYEGTKEVNDPEDQIKARLKLQEATVTESFRRQESIADGVTDQSIPLPDANSDYLWIFVDQQVSVKLNGSSDSITLSPKTAGKKTPVLFLRGDITGLLISNGSGSAANVDIISVNI